MEYFLDLTQSINPFTSNFTKPNPPFSLCVTFLHSLDLLVTTLNSHCDTSPLPWNQIWFFECLFILNASSLVVLVRSEQTVTLISYQKIEHILFVFITNWGKHYNCLNNKCRVQSITSINYQRMKKKKLSLWVVIFLEF